MERRFGIPEQEFKSNTPPPIPNPETGLSAIAKPEEGLNTHGSPDGNKSENEQLVKRLTELYGQEIGLKEKISDLKQVLSELSTKLSVEEKNDKIAMIQELTNELNLVQQEMNSIPEQFKDAPEKE